MTATTHGIYLVYGECNAYAPNLKPIAQRLVPVVSLTRDLDPEGTEIAEPAASVIDANPEF